MRRFFYSGDVNIEHGGMFYALDTWAEGYVDALRVVPCSDAGGPDNCFWIETLVINLPDSSNEVIKHGLEKAEGKLRDALHSCGWFDGGYDGGSKGKMSKATRRHVIVQALESYGGYGVDQMSSTLIRVGGPDRFYNGRDKFEPEKVLRGSASLENYARRLCRTEL